MEENSYLEVIYSAQSKVCNLAFAIGNHRQTSQESLGRRIIQSISRPKTHSCKLVNKNGIGTEKTEKLQSFILFALLVEAQRVHRCGASYIASASATRVHSTASRNSTGAPLKVTAATRNSCTSYRAPLFPKRFRG